MARKAYPPDKYRKWSAQAFGMFLIFAAITRGFDVVAYWHNYGMFRGVIKVITGLIGLYSIALLPIVIRDALKYKTFMELRDEVAQTKDKLESLETLTSLNTEDDTITTK